MYHALNVIRGDLIQLFKSKYIITKFTEHIKNYISDDTTIQTISKYVKTIEDTKIIAIDIKNVISMEKDINTSDITDYKDKLYRNTFFYKTSRRTSDNQIIGKYIETAIPYMDDKIISMIPERVKESDIYIGMSKVKLLKRYNIRKFNLLRLKKISYINFNIKDNKEETISKRINANIELIDIAISPKQLGIFNLNSKDGVINVKLKSSNNHNTIVSIPSPIHMYNDISQILLKDGIFIWEDVKYEKRLRRLFHLILVCSYTDNNNTSKINAEYTMFKTHFDELRKLDSIDKKLLYVNNNIVYRIDKDPNSDIIKNRVNKKSKNKYFNNVEHYKITITNNINKYYDELLCMYIKCLILSKYIIYDKVDQKVNHTIYVKNELQIHRIIELPNIKDYINDDIQILADNLTEIYKHIRGTSHRLNNEELLDSTKAQNLPDYDENIVNKFVNDITYNGIAKFEHLMRIYVESQIVILKGAKASGIETLTVDYESNALF